MEVFKDNKYPQHLFRIDSPEGLYVTTNEEKADALNNGWQDSYVPRNYPKWVQHAGGAMQQNPEAAALKMSRAAGIEAGFPDVPVMKLCKSEAEERAYIDKTKKKNKDELVAV